MNTLHPDVYYDPNDFEIDADPHPVWRRLRDERPLYTNERYGFFALSRFEDVERGLIDWQSFISSRGTVLELIKSNMQMPPGMIITWPSATASTSASARRSRGSRAASHSTRF